MTSKLVIVESPTKAKTIGRFLGKGYTVLSSYGHIRDLPKSELGVDTDTFTPRYIIPKKNQKNVTALKKAMTKADALILATDEDREGEAIAWHILETLKPDASVKTDRIVFHEITEHAIAEALAHPRTIDLKRVDAQQARRVLDRLVGYELSPLLWKKVVRGLSAGRVQSVALRLVVERERERKKFQKQAYWTIEAAYEKAGETFDAKLHAIDGKTLDKLAIATTEHANRIVADCGTEAHTVTAITKKKLTRTPPPPFTTSTLQQTANMELGFSAKQTMMLAQKLYEGIELGDEGSVGLITYMRTDSVNLSQKFVEEARAFANETHGATYVAPSPRTYATKSKGAQEAHEAIRPTSAMRVPASIQSYLEPRMWRLYDLIWRRAVATQMADATVESTGVTLTIKNYTFRSAGSVIAFDGFLKIAGRPAKEKILPALKEGETYTPKTLTPLEHSTEPPARYSDATLVKSLEEYGIGRPSTYAPTIATIIDRNYVRRDEKKRLEPTDIAFVVNDLLVEHFPSIVDYQFTANVEQELDAIAEGTRAWQEVLTLFYRPFHEQVQKKMDEISKKAVTEEATKEVCEKCGKPMVIKIGRFGKFLACTGFPECRNTKAINAEGVAEALPTTDEKCPTCGSGMIIKEGRFGRFIACSKYPTCKTTKPLTQSIGIPCPICAKGEIVARRSKRGRMFYGCNRYPECKAVFWSKPTGEKCASCGSLMVAGKADTIVCSNKECKGGISNS